MIIATGSVDINEATKIAQDASDSAGDLAEKMKSLKTSLDGTITESTNTPFDDGKEHNDGDMWLVMSGNVATSMYIYSGGSWTLKKWDVNSLSVEYLSALSANLGNVQAGNINGVNISGSTINGGTITGSTVHLSSGTDEYWLDYNGFHTVDTALNTGTWVQPGIITVGGTKANPAVAVAETGFFSYSKRIQTNGMTMSAGSVFGTASGDVYFEIGGGDSGQSGAALHAASFNKMSQLSVKRNLADVSGEYALAQISGTDIKRYDYKDSDNSQQTNIGPVIDDVNSNGNKAYSISSDLINKQTDGISLDNEIGLLMAAVKELTKRNSELTMRVAKLERKIQ